MKNYKDGKMANQTQKGPKKHFLGPKWHSESNRIEWSQTKFDVGQTNIGTFTANPKSIGFHLKK